MPIGPIPAASNGAEPPLAARLLGLLVPAVLSLTAFAVLISLGNWQMRRLAWKEDLIARVSERPRAEPLDLRWTPLGGIADDSFLDANEYRPALIVGQYQSAGEVLVFTSLSDGRGPFSGPGYWVFTPLATPVERHVVYINRGFVPEQRKRDYAPPPGDRVTVRGLIRSPERGSWFTPDPNLQDRTFFARDPSRIAAAMRLGSAEGFFLDLLSTETPPGGLPQAGETRMTFTNSHFGYAVTWYGLAAALLAVFASFAWTRLRPHHPGSQSRA